MKHLFLLLSLIGLIVFSRTVLAQPATCQIVLTDNTIISFNQSTGDVILLYQVSVVRTHYLSGYCHWNIKCRFIRQLDTYLGNGQYSYGTPEVVAVSPTWVDTASYLVDGVYNGYQGGWSQLFNSKILQEDTTYYRHGHGHYEILVEGYCICNPRGWVSPMPENTWRQFGDSVSFYGAGFPH